MNARTFYSWQSDIRATACRSFKTKIALAAILFICGPASVRATPVPTYVRISVETVGSNGLIPAANVRVDGCGCRDLPTCFDSCESSPIGGFTDSGGNLYLSNYGVPPSGTLFVSSATVDGMTLRGLALSAYNSVTLAIDPISEAAVEILVGHAYSGEQSVELLDLIRQANAGTSFGGLSLAEAIADARAAALADSDVQAALPAWTPTETPTVTPTPTPTPTRTLRPTGTPSACLGDCTNDGRVEIYELITAVNLALDQLPAAACAAGYPDGPPDVAELIAAVNNALYGCQPSRPLPDLVPVSVEPAPGPSCYYYNPPLCLTVCIANVGNLAAPPFTVSVDGGGEPVAWRVYGGLAAGDGECDLACVTSFVGSVVVDANDEVQESREHNNIAQFQFPTPTPPPRCPTPSPT